MDNYEHGHVLDLEFIKELYITQNLTVRQIFEQTQIPRRVIKHSIQKHGLVKSREAKYIARSKATYHKSKEAYIGTRKKEFINIKDHKFSKYIDFSRLKVLPPLKYNQVPNKEDFIYLYIELNLTELEVAQFYNKCRDSVLNYRYRFNVYKTDKQKKLADIRYNMDNFGVENSAQRLEVRQKYKDTCLQKYGTDNIFSSDIGKQKIKESNLKKYGVEHNHQSSQVVDKMKQTCLERYGDTCSLNNPEVKEKAKQTWVKNLGVDHPWKSSKIRNNISETIREKYGDEVYARTNYFKELCLQHKDEWVEKAYKTFKKNKTYRDSKEELQLYNLLLDKYPDCIHHPPKTKQYPFVCDFYIPSLDLYIEYNGHPCHGFTPFTLSNDNLIRFRELLHKALFHKVKKTRKTYSGWLFQWVIGDRCKRGTAYKNNLNYVEWFSYKEAISWIKD